MTYVDTPQSRCRFGLAQADITPPVGIYHRMWGAAEHDRSEGVHRPLTATVMVFQPLQVNPDSAARHGIQVLVALDHCLLGAAESEQLLDTVSREANIEREVILVVFSHTHAAGLMSLDRVELPGGELIPAYLEQLNATIAGLVRQALLNSFAATFTFGTGRCGLAANRDQWDDERQQFVCGFNPGAPADDTLLVARINDDEGAIRGSIVHYACHPTTLAWDNRLISPDYPGAMRELVEQATAAPCVFLQGASGDLGPRHGFVGDVDVADRNGWQLGFAVLSVLESLPPPETRYQYRGPVMSGATIGVWDHVPLPKARHAELSRWHTRRWSLDLSYRPGLPTVAETEADRARWLQEEQRAQAANDSFSAREYRALAERKSRLLGRLKGLPPGKHYPYRIAMWQIGDAFWIGVPGEPYNVLQQTLRKRFPNQALVVCTLGGGWGPSYLPPAELYDRGLYQESIAVVDAGSLEMLIDDVSQNIGAILRTTGAAP